jgi:hypothetical protein
VRGTRPKSVTGKGQGAASACAGNQRRIFARLLGLYPKEDQHRPPRNGLGGKFQQKSSAWDENRTFLEGDVLEVEYAMAARVLTHVPAGPRPAPPPAQHYFPTEE